MAANRYSLQPLKEKRLDYNKPGNMALTPVTINSIPNDISNRPMIRVTTLIPV